ncbi:MAG: hypothetical protein KBC27_02630 [Rickettsiales bacterium]|nr:hypothetical protein [Rickettsiales bacterium]
MTTDILRKNYKYPLMYQTLHKHILEPILAFKKQYWPIVILYFAYGFSGFTAIAETFWIKNDLTLSTSEILQLAFWAHMPWTYKIIFSQFVDNLSIIKSRRKSYICLGAFLMIIGYIIFIATVHGFIYLSLYSQLTISSIIISAGIVLQDLVADTLCLEIVISEKKQHKLSDQEYKYRLGLVQLLGRLGLMFGILLAAFFGGILAEYLHLKTICWFLLVIPIISCSSIMFFKEAPNIQNSNLDKPLVVLTFAMTITTIISSLVNIGAKAEINFIINLFFTLIMMKYVLKHLSLGKLKELIGLGIVIFFFRTTPSFGPGIEWWQIDTLKFTPQFFGILSQTGTLLGFFATLFFSTYILKYNIRTVLIILALLSALLKLPFIGMAYGLHDWTMQHFGFGAKTIAIIDVVSEDPFSTLSMIPLLALSAYYAPKQNKVTWFALVANFMNLALSAGTLLTKHLQTFFQITRGNYKKIGPLMTTCTILDIALPITAILLVSLWQKNSKKL